MRLWPSGRLWRHGDFLKLWSAEAISQVGFEVSALALLLAILVLDASAFEVALLGATIVGGAAVATWFGLRTAIWVGAAGNALVFPRVLLSPVRWLERIPEPAEEPAPPTAATGVPAPVER